MSLILRVIALVLFILAAVGGVAGEPPVELVAWGLAAWVLATIVGDVPVGIARRDI